MKKRATKEAAINRPSKKKASGFTDHIRQTPSPINDPRKVEHFMSDDGQRMTRVDYGPLSNLVLVSADHLMACGRLFPASLVERNPWHFLGPWLETPEGDFARFWACYKSETAEKERRIAVIGKKHCNRTNERNLLHAVHEYKALSLQDFGFELGKDEPPSILANAGLSEDARAAVMANLKEKMVDWVLESVWNDHEAPKRLHEILKNKSAAESEYSDQPTVNGRIFNEFVQKLAEHWCLPTKKAVRIGAGFGNEDKDETAASRAFAKLGLNGLPEA
jgi:hypothetical protein